MPSAVIGSLCGTQYQKAALQGGPSELRRLLQQDHLVAEPAAEQGGGEPPAATADDHDVGLHVHGTGRCRPRRLPHRDPVRAHRRPLLW